MCHILMSCMYHISILSILSRVIHMLQIYYQTMHNNKDWPNTLILTNLVCHLMVHPLIQLHTIQTLVLIKMQQTE